MKKLAHYGVLVNGIGHAETVGSIAPAKGLPGVADWRGRRSPLTGYLVFDWGTGSAFVCGMLHFGSLMIFGRK